MNKSFLKTTTILCGIISAPLMLLASYTETRINPRIEEPTSFVINGNTVSVGGVGDGQGVTVNDQTIISKEVWGDTTLVTGGRGNKLLVDNVGDDQSIVVNDATIASKSVDPDSGATIITTPVSLSDVAEVAEDTMNHAGVTVSAPTVKNRRSSRGQ